MSDDHSTSVTDKVMALLGAFTHETPALTLTELSRRTGLSLPTVHRRAAELVAWGALERGTDRRYRIGLRLWETAALAPRGLGLRNAAMPFLQELYEATQEQHIHLAVRDHLDIVFLERLSGPDAPPICSRIGGRYGVLAMSTGLVLLAHAPVDVQNEYLNAPLLRYTEHTVTDRVQLRAMLAAIRRDGYCVSDRTVGAEIVSVGAPIHGSDGSVVAAVSAGVRAGSRPARALTPTVLTAARKISRALRA